MARAFKLKCIEEILNLYLSDEDELEELLTKIGSSR